MLKDLLNNQGLLALIGALLGGTGLKMIEHWLNKSRSKEDQASKFRDEQREEIVRLREELRKCEEDVDKWRIKYYEVMDQYHKFKQAYEKLGGRPLDTGGWE